MDVSMNVNSMPFEHLAAIIFGGIVIVAIVFISGVSFKIGEKEYNIGGLRRLIAKKDEDALLKERLKKFSDETDHETEADLYDAIEDMDSRLEKEILEKGEHCFFTWEQFTSLVKRELQKRVRRNNLRERLAEGSREKYVRKVLQDVQEKYELFQRRAASAKCEDRYAEFAVIREAVYRELCTFFDQAKAVLVAGMKKKIAEYEKTAPEFKTAKARKFSCDYPAAKNKGYIKSLTGEAL